MIGVEVGPDMFEPAHANAKARGITSQYAGIDSTGRGAADDRERNGFLIGQQFADGFQDADLIRRAGATAG